jgi:ABC-type amino acid transport substrate-binding protein
MARPLHPCPTRRQCLAGLAGAALAACAPGVASAPSATPTLDKLRLRGTLSVALYNDMPPFHVKGHGIDVALAEQLATALGLKLSLLPFTADDNMNDDLRNMVWKGHYLGFGPADVMLHVPVDRPLMNDNPKVKIFAPYYRERIVVARDAKAFPTMDSMADFKGGKLAVPGQTLAGWLLIGADGGAYREQLLTPWKDGCEAARALQRGEVVAAAGHASELESVLAGDERFVMAPLPVPRMKEGWVVGCAVKAEATDLALAVQEAINGMASSGAMAAAFQRGKVAWRQP